MIKEMLRKCYENESQFLFQNLLVENPKKSYRRKAYTGFFQIERMFEPFFRTAQMFVPAYLEDATFLKPPLPQFYCC